MCLIMTGTANAVRQALINTPGLAGDIYRSNSDGIGAMYANKRGLKVAKLIPKKAADVAKFIMALPDDDRQLALHWRMRTHGHVTLDNCHPYPITPKAAMMHNGVLSIGNARDATRSDTYHFIEEYLREAVEKYAPLVHDEGFLSMVGDFIGGSNRFVFMTADGQMSIVNKDTGIEHGGIWFSNTYAWSPEILIPGYKPRWVYTPNASRHWSEDDEEEYDSWQKRHNTHNYRALTHHSTSNVTPITPVTPTIQVGGGTEDRPGYWSDSTQDLFLAAVQSYDYDEIEWMLARWPYSAMESVTRHPTLSAYRLPPEPGTEYTPDEERVIELFERCALKDLADEARSRPKHVSRVMTQRLYWYEHTDRDAEDVADSEDDGDTKPLTGDLQFPANDSFDDAEVPEHAYKQLEG